MSKNILYLALAIIVAVTGLGYLNHQRYEALIAEKNKSTEELQHANAALKTQLTSAQQQLVSLAAEASRNRNAALSVQQFQQAAVAKITELQKQLADAAATIAQQKNDLASKDATIQQLQQQLQQAATSIKSTGTKKDLEEALTKLKKAQMEIQAFKQRELDQKKKFSNGGLEGKVLAVNSTWNFVVINLGDQNGVNKDTEMLIKRGDQIVAKIKITSVEPLTSIANIIPGTLSSGLSLQAGDVVIYNGPENNMK